MAEQQIPEEEEEDQAPVTLKKRPLFAKELRYTAVIILTLLAGFFTWAAFAPLESISIAPGSITVASSNKMIQHPQGGRIKKVYVKESQHVNEGDPLLLIDDPQVEAKKYALEKSKYFYEIKRARLRAILQGLPNVPYSQEILEKIASDEEISLLMKTENELFEKGVQTHKAELLVLHQQLAQFDQQLEQIQSNIRASKAQKGYLEEEIKAVKYLLEKQLARKPRLLALQRENVRLEGEISKNLSELGRIQHQKQEIEAKIAAVTEDWNKKNLTELEEAEQHLLEINPQLIAAQDQQGHLIIRSPVSGIVKGLRYKSAGEVIPSNQLIMEVVPLGEQLVVEAHLNPNDVKEVHPGLKAKIVISSFSYRYTPNFFGKVQYVSPDAFVSEKDNTRYYLVRVSDFDEQWKLIESQLTPGMPVEVMIINDKRTLLYYIFSPLWESLGRAFRER